MRDIDGFVSAILSARGSVEKASFVIDQAVFEPRHLNAVIAEGGCPAHIQRDIVISMVDAWEAEILLRAAFRDWIDFVFVPNPKTFCIYCDHDEYTTFYANTATHLRRMTESLVSGGYESVRDWERKL